MSAALISVPTVAWVSPAYAPAALYQRKFGLSVGLPYESGDAS